MTDWFWRYGSEVWQRTQEHLILVGLSLGIAIVLGLPLGILITRYPRLGVPIFGLANGIQTIPSLALFGFLIPLPWIGGIGTRTAIIALTLYSLLPIIRNTYTGIQSVDPAVREAGRAMGMTDWQLLWRVELPLSLSVILAGVRLSAVIGVGLATIAAPIGAGGLGELIFRGVAVLDNLRILSGAIPATLMALLLDLGLQWLSRRLTFTITHQEESC